MQLPEDIQIDPQVQPVKLSTNCSPVQTNETVVVAGTGDFSIEESAFNDLPILRHAYSEIIPCDNWEKLIEQGVDQSMLICTNVIDNRGAFSGDSGAYLKLTLSNIKNIISINLSLSMSFQAALCFANKTVH